MYAHQMRESIVSNLVDVTRTMVDTPFDQHNHSIRRGRERDYNVCKELHRIAADEKFWTGESRSLPMNSELRESLELIKFRLMLIGQLFEPREG